MGRRHDTVSFLTDYGLDDEFVGVLKAVIRDLAPHVTVIDLTHGIRPYDVRAGSLALARAIPYVPAGVVLAVVDPGVGTSRRAVAVEVAGGEGVLVGPDNGLLGPAVGIFAGGLLIEGYGWRAAFVVFGVVSLLWLLPWSRVRMQQRAAQPLSADVASIWMILRQRSLWGTALGHFSSNYTFYFMLSWLPVYLVRERGFSNLEMAQLE